MGADHVHSTRAENLMVLGGWPVASFAAFAILHWTSTNTVVAGAAQLSCAVGGLFFGTLLVDLGVALGRGIARRRGVTAGVGNYSSVMGFSLILLAIWWMAAANSDGPGWTANIVAVMAVSLVALVGQAALLRLVTQRLGLDPA